MARIAGFLVFLLVALSAAEASAADTVSVGDPAGGTRWTAKQSVSSGGRICVQLRRGKKAKGQTCSRLDGRLAFSYNVRTETGATPRATRTILIAAFAPDVVSARLAAPGGTRTYRRRSGKPRVLLVVLSGRVERPLLTAKVSRGGKLVSVEQGPEPAVTVADPLGGAGWRTRRAEASGGSVCVAWERVQPRYGAVPSPAQGTPRCGPADAVVPVAAAQVVSGRLVIFGRAGSAVTSTVLRGPSGDRSLALETSTHAVLAVLPGGTDPASLRLVARTADGREVERAVDVVQ
jgi:hypothetical protein